MNDTMLLDFKDLLPRLQDTADRSEIEQAINRHFLSPDDRRADDAWFDSVYTEDFVLIVPTGTYTGREGMREALRTSAVVFERSHHLVSNHVIEIDADGAAIRSKIIATHLQRADDQGDAFTGGADYTFTARRTGNGWRLSRAEYIAVWTRGTPPTPPAEPSGSQG
ncbi:nuclear transport factor 2 family protein [Actinomadura rugatobispora]|uniref:Nuclear transport factor 2 family protein n=1 Tax=Actinomadura rugatobispora TaxID=1994 RepID=A0ABW0ZP58_9ACTN|nr:hypothetical protein GCM10010200_094630 [Actinomadura rugatobispora]